MTGHAKRGDATARQVDLRRATLDDAPEIADVWLTSFRATYPGWPQVHTDNQVRSWIHDVVVKHEESWVAVDQTGTIAGFMALTATDLDQLYVLPDRTGRGIGSQLVALAKRRRPDGLRLYTFQVNTGARRFYERRGFRVIDLNPGERNEEQQPDIQYAWGPAGATPHPAGAPPGGRPP